MTNESGRILVFDCFSGIAGDMALAALVDAGADIEQIRTAISQIDLPPVTLRTAGVTRGGLSALHVAVEPAHEAHYEAPEMRTLIGAAPVPERVRSRAIAAVDLLAEAEAHVHGEGAAFHEVGGVDAVVDIVGTMFALELLDVESCYCPSVTVGSGTIARAAHGAIPAAPGPAAARILEDAGFPMRFVSSSHELVTPTGAAILAAVAEPGAALLVSEVHGAGAGTIEADERPNALRVFLGRRVAEESPTPNIALPGTRAVTLLEANIDDMAATLLAHVRDLLLADGALDAWTEAIGMKKGRAATKLCALVPAGEEARLSGVMLRETTTLGVRSVRYDRFELERAIETISTEFGPVRVKFSQRGGKRIGAPEYDDVIAIAARDGIPATQVQARLEQEINGDLPG